MKKVNQKFNFSLLSLFAALFILISSCSEDENIVSDASTLAASQTTELLTEKQSTTNITISAISDTDGILFMREEEKLARDVYDYLHLKWNSKIFDNISNSEQVHMDRMLDLINLFNLEDPALPEAGAFANEDLQNLYNDLIAIADSSLVSALTVGAIIEEVDIIDLQDYYAATNNEDIKCVYANLSKGSRNHLRAYYHKLEWMGVTYTPQFMDEDEFYAIVNSPHEIGGTPCNF